jgi:hypothetical protein
MACATRSIRACKARSDFLSQITKGSPRAAFCFKNLFRTVEKKSRPEAAKSIAP